MSSETYCHDNIPLMNCFADEIEDVSGGNNMFRKTFAIFERVFLRPIIDNMERRIT